MGPNQSVIRLFFVLLLCASRIAEADPTGPPSVYLPRGVILPFLPDLQSEDYSDMDGLKRWLSGQGWALCDGSNGTPDLHSRYLVGTRYPEDTGQRLGRSSHDHRVQTHTGREQGRERRFDRGRFTGIRLPHDGHSHEVDTATSASENLPPSTRVLFIMKVR